MIGEVRIYIEGGGDSQYTKRQLRLGFGEFLESLRNAARDNRARWQLVMCGPRDAAYRAFVLAVRDHPDAFNVLLVDAEGPVHQSPGQHLGPLDDWHLLAPDDDRAQLMAQAMEAWLIADVGALQTFYGPRFLVNQMPGRPNVEEIPKAELARALRAATRHTQKGDYRKIAHASQLLARLDAPTVRARAPHCDRLFRTVEAKLAAP